MNEQDRENELQDKQWELTWDIRRSIRYHMARQAFFEDFNRVVTGMNVLLSSSAMAALLSSHMKEFAPWLMFAVAVFNTLDLVIGTSKAAWLHRDLKNRFIDLEKRFCKTAQVTKENLDEATAIRLSIESEEPPIFRTLDLVCHNELVEAIRWTNESEKLENLKKIPKVKWLLRNIYRY
ncbi:hypothetical protein [Rheinheimera sp. 1928-s]|uniref:hypothetical protein n=1 Tax=Rheinheimera sp. 1928-s TaxID=3033803 RepID=UPI0026131106|nr:hypothetical protein [Rheinheimera sp. 1928-s]MDF3126989.1 hypothetical protein [Rheinheimera sp. 1928-s]